MTGEAAPVDRYDAHLAYLKAHPGVRDVVVSGGDVANVPWKQLEAYLMGLLSVPTVRDISLWGPRVQEAFAAMGAIEFATVDAAAQLENDARVADEFDARLRLREALPH